MGGPVTGAVETTRVMLVGQAPGPREADERRPFAYTAGKRLFQWMDELGVTEEEFRKRVYIAAAIRCFPGRDPRAGGDRVPTLVEIANCARHLDREISLLEPQLVIAVGTLAAKQFLNGDKLDALVGKVHKTSRAGASFDVVVLPHPSGRSTWINDERRRLLLRRSLRLIGKHPAFQATFERTSRPRRG